MNYPSAREEFDRLMRLQFPEGRPRNGSLLERPPLNPELVKAIAEGKAERAREAEQAEQRRAESEKANNAGS